MKIDGNTLHINMITSLALVSKYSKKRYREEQKHQRE